MKTGTSMSGFIDTRKTKAIPCDCSKCYHSERLNSSLGFSGRYCKYYDLLNPKKKSCAKYYSVRQSSNKKLKR